MMEFSLGRVLGSGEGVISTKRETYDGVRERVGTLPFIFTFIPLPPPLPLPPSPPLMELPGALQGLMIPR